MPKADEVIEGSSSTSSEAYCHVCSKQFRILNEFKQHLGSKFHKKNEETKDQNKRMNNKCCLFITGFPETLRQEEILEYFKQFGGIRAAKFVRNFLFLDYTNATSAREVFEKQHFLGGRKLFIDYREQRANIKVTKLSEDFHTTWVNALLSTVNFENEVQCLLQNIQPKTHSVYLTVNNICSDILAAVSYLSPHINVHNFGSTVTGLQLNFSDLDIYIGGIRDISKEKDDVNSLYRIKHGLTISQKFGNAFVIPKAKIPILKCVHLETMINIDINVKNMLGVCNSHLIRFYLGIHWKIKALMVVLKFWANVHKLTGQNHLLTNYSLCLLFFFYLQQKPYSLPSVAELQIDRIDFQGGWNAGFNTPLILCEAVYSTPSLEILKGFFEFYLNFPYSTKVICPFLGYTLNKSAFADPNFLPEQFSLYKNNILNLNFETLYVNSCLCLQDPFEHNRNTTKVLSVTILENFVSLCEFGRRLCCENNNTLHKLLTQVPTTFKKTLTITNDILVFTISMRQCLGYLKQTEKSVREKEWFEIIGRFIHTVLTKVLKFAVVDKTNEILPSKNSKRENQTNIHEDKSENVTYLCSGKINLWDNRKSMTKLHKDFGDSILQKQIEVTNQLSSVYKHLQDSEDVIKFELSISFLADKPGVKMKLKKIRAYKKSFRSFAVFFSRNIPCWFETYEKELCFSKYDI